MALGTTDLTTLKAVFRAAVEGLSPTHVRSQVIGWHSIPGDRPARPGHAMRVFTLRFEPSNFVPDGLYGEEYAGVGVHEVESYLVVTVDYGGVPSEVLDEVVDDDLYDLAATFEDLAAPTTTGLVSVENIGDPIDIADDNEGDQAQVEFRFLVRYMKLRPS